VCHYPRRRARHGEKKLGGASSSPALNNEKSSNRRGDAWGPPRKVKTRKKRTEKTQHHPKQEKKNPGGNRREQCGKSQRRFLRPGEKKKKPNLIGDFEQRYFPAHVKKSPSDRIGGPKEKKKRGGWHLQLQRRKKEGGLSACQNSPRAPNEGRYKCKEVNRIENKSIKTRV